MPASVSALSNASRTSAGMAWSAPPKMARTGQAKLVASSAGAGGAAEVVERDRGHPRLREAQRELLEERMQAAHVREDDHAGAGWIGGAGGVGSDPGAVGGGEGQVARIEGGATNRRRRRSC